MKGKVSLVCEVCNKSFPRFRSQVKKHNFCGVQCRFRFQSIDPNHQHWRKGHRHTKETIEKITIAIRDNFAKGYVHNCLGVPKREETKAKISMSLKGKGTGPQNPNWKGGINTQSVAYRYIHKWIERRLGKPKECENCGITETGHKMHWANLNHLYRTNLSDWMRLCASCHKKHDINLINI